MFPLADVPAVVAPLLDVIDLFPSILADVAHPQIAGLAIEAPAPRIAKAIAPDRRVRPCIADERVVGGNFVLARGRVRVDAKNLCELHRETLTIAARIVARPAVAEARVEHPVW